MLAKWMASLLVAVLCMYMFPERSLGTDNATQLTWITCGVCGSVPEVGIADNSIRMGVYDRLESASQPESFHGAAALLTPASQYVITFNYDLYSWDSYISPTEIGRGYWDSFSVSVGSNPIWQLSIDDPITTDNVPGLGFIWGGARWGDNVLKHVAGRMTVVVNGNPGANNYLSVGLNTRLAPENDARFPSWGTITIVNIESSDSLASLGIQAAALAKTVVGGDYLWGGKGWNWNPPREYVSSQKIVSDGYSYYKADSKSIEFGKGLDCSGLIMWAYNRSTGSSKYPGEPIFAEGAQGQRDYNTTPINEGELRPGDLLFFSNSASGTAITHVAVFVGGANPQQNVVEAANQVEGIKYSSLDERKSSVQFRGFGRLKYTQMGLIVQSNSPVSLVVTDPDGLTVDTNTLKVTEEEYVRGIEGALYYSTNEFGDDLVYSPILKQGNYDIKVVPNPDSDPSETFGLSVVGAAKLIDLAQDVPISQIPAEGYQIAVSQSEINIAAKRIFLPLISYAPAPVEPFNVSILASSQREYRLMRAEDGNGLRSGNLVYSDRTYLYESVPASISGLSYIATANDDKNTFDSNLSVSITVNRPVVLYVAHSDDHESKPAWLGAFQDTGRDLTFSYSDGTVVLSVFSATFPAGTIHLGGNGTLGSGSHTMYTMAFREANVVGSMETKQER